ncbi:MAG: PilW family protein [Pseudomonadota bacterium]|nr:PilW family protein [Pseudomonadota bacterium]
MKQRSIHHIQRGFSLIELMISLAIGLLILAAVAVVYQSSSRTSRISESDTTLNEEGLIALSILQQQLRQAGYFRPSGAGGNDPRNFTGAAIRACDGGFVVKNAAFDALACNGGTGSDAIAIRYEANAFNTVQSGGNPVNCTGAAIATGFASNNRGTPFTMADNRYFIGNNNLSCQGATSPLTFDNAAQALMANVEDLQLRFGVTTTADFNDNQIIDYLNASEIADADWGRVVSVQICVLMHSTRQSNRDLTETAQAYRDCRGRETTSTDGLTRRSYITTVALRNRTSVPTTIE